MRPLFAPILLAGLTLALLTPATAAEVPHTDSRTAIVRLPSATRIIPLKPPVRLLARRPRQTLSTPLPALPAPAPRPQAPKAVIDDRPFWAAVAKGDLARARAIHSKLRASGIPWPEGDRALALLTLLQAEADYKQAASTQDWDRVITLADRVPELVSCQRAYNFWPLADAYHSLGRTAKLADLYNSIVGACAGEQDRLTAIEHAFEQIPATAAADLLVLERPHNRSAAGDERFDALEYRLNGSRLSASLADPASGNDVADIEDAIGPGVLVRQDTTTAVNLGWSNFRTGRLTKAEEWFRAALAWSADTGAAEGLTNTLLRREQPAEAAVVVDEYLDGDPRAQPLRQRIHQAIAAQALADGSYEEAVTQAAAARDQGATGPGVAMVEAWALLQSGQAEAALAGFNSAAAQGGGDDATLGRVRAHLALDQLAEAQQAAAELPPSMAANVEPEINIRLADQAYKDRRYGDSILHAQRAQSSPDFAVDALVIEAWSRFRLGNLKTSQTLFEWLYRTDPSKDYADGLYLSLSRDNKQPRLRELADELGGALKDRVRRAEIFGG